MNPETKPTPDEPWIYDCNAVDFIVEVGDHETAAKACEGLAIHCFLCGLAFPLWPPKELMGHLQVEHAKELTIQQLSGCAELCSSDWNVHSVQFFGQQLVTRAGLRRKVRDLGLVKFTDIAETKLLGPDGRRVQ